MKISQKELDEFLFEETHPAIARRKSIHQSNDDDWFDATIEAFEQGDNINNEESEVDIIYRFQNSGYDFEDLERRPFIVYKHILQELEKFVLPEREDEHQELTDLLEDKHYLEVVAPVEGHIKTSRRFQLAVNKAYAKWKIA